MPSSRSSLSLTRLSWWNSFFLILWLAVVYFFYFLRDHFHNLSPMENDPRRWTYALLISASGLSILLNLLAFSIPKKSRKQFLLIALYLPLALSLVSLYFFPWNGILLGVLILAVFFVLLKKAGKANKEKQA